MQTANQQNNSSITPLSDPGSSSSSSTQQNLLNENNNIGQQITYPPPQLQYLLANLVARNQAASNPSLASIVANMQLSVVVKLSFFRLNIFYGNLTHSLGCSLKLKITKLN